MAKKKPKTSASQFSALVLRALKQEVNQKAGDLIESLLKPKHVELPPKGLVIGNQKGPTSASKMGPPGFKGSLVKPGYPAPLLLALVRGDRVGYGSPAG